MPVYRKPRLTDSESDKKLKKIKEIADKAILYKTIYQIRGGFPSLRQALSDRGWTDKGYFGQFPVDETVCAISSLVHKAEPGNLYESIILSKLLLSVEPNFIWQNKGRDLRCPKAKNTPFRNRIQHLEDLDFTTKEGLVRCVRLKRWYTMRGVAELATPRCYLITEGDSQNEFWTNFKKTGCIGLLRFLVESDKPFASYGVINGKWIDFALDRVSEEIRSHTHEDIDLSRSAEYIGEEIWTEFFTNYQNLVLRGHSFKVTTKMMQQKTMANLALKQIFDIWPDLRNDGYLNTWIVKPGNKCRGIGITLFHEMSKIKQFIRTNVNQRYVIQKYIERPLLIHETKFDIRQHFLVTINSHSQTIWMYKKCYIRFSSQLFKIKNLRLAVHLTNYSVQKNFQNCASRSPMLPDHNMWSLEEFKGYLSSIGKENVWEKRIVPTMKKNIIAVVLCAQEKTVFVKNTFELYGCDFLIGENFETYLLEVNSSPDMASSTPVTSALCPQVMKDVVKIVIDRSSCSSAPIGDFEEIYSYRYPNDTSRLQILKLAVSGINYKTVQRCIKDHTFVDGYAKSEINIATPINASKSTSIKSPTSKKEHHHFNLFNLSQKNILTEKSTTSISNSSKISPRNSNKDTGKKVSFMPIKKASQFFDTRLHLSKSPRSFRKLMEKRSSDFTNNQKEKKDLKSQDEKDLSNVIMHSGTTYGGANDPSFEEKSRIVLDSKWLNANTNCGITGFKRTTKLWFYNKDQDKWISWDDVAANNISGA